MNEDLSKNVLKTGTLTIGIVCKDGILLAADNRVTYGSGNGVSYIAGKLKKIFPVNEKMLATIAGTASDATRVISLLRAELRLKELKTKEESAVEEVAHLVSNMQFSNIRQFSVIPSIAHFVLAGYDQTGTHLFEISPDGHLKEVEDYAVSGAPLQAHAILDSEYKSNITLAEATELAIKCLKTTMGREPGVGEGFDIYTIKKGEIKQILAKDFVFEVRDKK